MTARSKLKTVRLANQAEKQLYGGEVVFIREDRYGVEYRIYAIAVEGSYQQWGAPKEVLGDNVPAVRAWAKSPDKLPLRYVSAR